MFTIGICDDEALIRKFIHKNIDTFFSDKTGEYNVVEFSDGNDFLRWIDKEASTIDLLFLDIEMPGKDGISIKDMLEKNDNVERIVFVTSHIENMQDAFGLKVVGFLIKPVSDEDICRRLKDNYNDYLNDKVIQIDNENYIKESQISYIKSEGIYCDIFLINGESIKTVRNSLAAYKKNLGDSFIQVHRSYLINACDVKRNEKNQVMLSNDVQVPIGRSYKKIFQESYRNIAMKRAKGRM